MVAMQLDIVTAERLVSSDEVELVVAPGIDGELGILPSHAPLLTALAAGEIKVVKDGEESFIAIGGGFMEIIGNKVTILADTAERAEEIDAERAEEALARAQEQIDSTSSVDMNLERAMASIRRSQARLKVAHRHRPRRDPGAPLPG